MRTSFASERSVLGILAVVAFAQASFWLVANLGIPQHPQRMLSAFTGARLLLFNFAVDFAASLVMWAVIEPVRLFGPGAGVRRFTAIGGAVIVATALATIGLLEFLDAIWDSAALVHLEVDPSQLVEREPLLRLDRSDWSRYVRAAIRFGVLASLLVIVGEFNRREVLSIEAMHKVERDRASLEQQTMQARLKTLEAQIEPHFLFNTLANVRRLCETDAVVGKPMLRRLTRYLEIALPTMRSERSTLAREAELIAAYLDLQRVRMGRRLDYRLAIEPSLHGVEVPPMMLLTLVENAIKHGIAPLREGGRVDVEARAEGGELRLTVGDTGRGFGGDTSGGGAGLANIRARLQAMFGSAGRLSLVPVQPSGVEATIRLPLARS